MGRALKWIAIVVGSLMTLALLGTGAFAAFNWTLVRNMTTLTDVTPLDVEPHRPLAVVAGAATRTPLPRAAPVDQGVAAEAIAEAQAYHEQMGGYGLMIWRDGAVVHEAYTDGVTADTLTNSFSINKSVTALAIGAAIEDGLLPGLDAPMRDLLPAWSGDDPRGAITLRQLLTMSAGLKHPQFSEWAGLQLFLSSRVERTALSLPLDGEPGAAFQYSNARTQVAGAALRAALAERGEDYASYLSRRIWAPIGAGDAQIWLEREGGAPRVYAGLFARLEDYLRLGLLMENNGRVGDAQVLPESWIAEMTTPSATNPNYGLQVWLGSPPDGARSYGPAVPVTVPHSAPYAADDIVFFDGFGGQRVYVVPSARLVVARTGAVNLQYDDAIIVNALLAGLGPPRTTPPPDAPG